VVLLGTLLGGCTTGHKAARPIPEPGGSTAPASGTLVVFASSELKGAFDKLAAQFAADNPGVTVTTTYQGPQALATALQAGSHADLVAAEADSMAALATAGPVVTTAVQPLARNPLEIVVPAGNPKGIEAPADLARPGVTLVLVDPALPAGRDALMALALAGVRAAPKSSVTSVSQLVTAVATGNADAGMAYRSDVVAGDSGVTGVALPAPSSVTETYQIAVLRDASNASAAGAFVQFVRSPRGRAILETVGLTPGG
jgi:molybdate transport system substrate-binding protein